MSVASRIPQSASALKVLTASLLAQLSEQTRQIETQAAQLATQSGQIETQITQLKHQSIYIDKLKFELTRLKRWRFGAASEAVGSEQIALWEAELDGDIAAAEARLAQLAGTTAPEAPETARTTAGVAAAEDPTQAQAAARLAATGRDAARTGLLHLPGVRLGTDAHG